MPRRLLSLWFPRLGAERLLRQARAEAALHEVPFAVVEDISNSQILSSVSARASEVGIYKGQPLRFGPEYIIPKPFDPMTLANQVKAIWNRRDG